MYKRVNINEEYIQSIEDELINLDDYIPMIIDSSTSTNFRKKRNQFLNSSDNSQINEIIMNERMKFKNFDSSKERVNYIYNQVKDFVNKYPKWDKIIKSVDNIN